MTTGNLTSLRDYLGQTPAAATPNTGRVPFRNFAGWSSGTAPVGQPSSTTPTSGATGLGDLGTLSPILGALLSQFGYPGSLAALGLSAAGSPNPAGTLLKAGVSYLPKIGAPPATGIGAGANTVAALLNALASAGLLGDKGGGIAGTYGPVLSGIANIYPAAQAAAIAAAESAATFGAAGAAGAASAGFGGLAIPLAFMDWQSIVSGLTGGAEKKLNPTEQFYRTVGALPQFDDATTPNDPLYEGSLGNLANLMWMGGAKDYVGGVDVKRPSRYAYDFALNQLKKQGGYWGTPSNEDAPLWHTLKPGTEQGWLNTKLAHVLSGGPASYPEGYFSEAALAPYLAGLPGGVGLTPDESDPVTMALAALSGGGGG